VAKNSGIEWCDHTWNPWQGCHPVSEGCANCYMYREKKRYKQDPTKVVRSSKQTFNAPLKWKESAKVFTCSWSDFFIAEADQWRDEAMEIIAKTPHLTYLILTKRPERMNEYFKNNFILSNIWLGVTAENQKTANERIPILLEVPAAIRFVSVEPMLEEIDLTRVNYKPNYHRNYLSFFNPTAERLDWVICGGETGHGAREMKAKWAWSLYNQCKDAGVPFFFKKPGNAFRGGELPNIRKYPKG